MTAGKPLIGLAIAIQETEARRLHHHSTERLRIERRLKVLRELYAK